VSKNASHHGLPHSRRKLLFGSGRGDIHPALLQGVLQCRTGPAHPKNRRICRVDQTPEKCVVAENRAMHKQVRTQSVRCSTISSGEDCRYCARNRLASGVPSFQETRRARKSSSESFGAILIAASTILEAMANRFLSKNRTATNRINSGLARLSRCLHRKRILSSALQLS